jgi:hypothetical protein
MEFLADIFWTALVGLWFINQFRAIKKRQAPGANEKSLEDSPVDATGIEAMDDWLYMENTDKSDYNNERRPQEEGPVQPTGLLDIFADQFASSFEPVSEPEQAQIDPLVSESISESKVMADSYTKAQERSSFKEERYSRSRRSIRSTKHKVDSPGVTNERKSILPYLTGGDVSQLKRAIVLSEVFGPPLSMRKPEGQFSGPMD